LGAKADERSLILHVECAQTLFVISDHFLLALWLRLTLKYFVSVCSVLAGDPIIAWLGERINKPKVLLKTAIPHHGSLVQPNEP